MDFSQLRAAKSTFFAIQPVKLDFTERQNSHLAGIQ